MITPNIEIECPANTNTFTQHSKSIRIPKEYDGFILKQIIVYFSPGCKTSVRVKIKDKRGQMIPDPKITALDSIFGDDIEFPPFKINMVLKGDNSEFFVHYKNTDDLAHTIQVTFVIVPKDKKEE
jgi:hypothetical protein